MWSEIDYSLNFTQRIKYVSVNMHCQGSLCFYKTNVLHSTRTLINVWKKNKCYVVQHESSSVPSLQEFVFTSLPQQQVACNG